MPDLLEQIDAFLDRHAMEATTFGTRAVGDGHFVKDLRNGRKPYRRTVKSVLDFMARQDKKQGSKNGSSRPSR